MVRKNYEFHVFIKLDGLIFQVFLVHYGFEFTDDYCPICGAQLETTDLKRVKKILDLKNRKTISLDDEHGKKIIEHAKNLLIEICTVCRNNNYLKFANNRSSFLKNY